MGLTGLISIVFRCTITLIPLSIQTSCLYERQPPCVSVPFRTPARGHPVADVHATGMGRRSELWGRYGLLFRSFH